MSAKFRFEGQSGCLLREPEGPEKVQQIFKAILQPGDGRSVWVDAPGFSHTTGRGRGRGREPPKN